MHMPVSNLGECRRPPPPSQLMLTGGRLVSNVRYFTNKMIQLFCSLIFEIRVYNTGRQDKIAILA